MKGDFIGFSFNGIHSSELGIIRISDGSRYNNDLLPPFQDKTNKVINSDITNYYGSNYSSKPINMNIAFDDLSERQIRELKILFGDKEIHQLILDELPYKIYYAKIANSPNLKTICFDKEDWNGNINRVYKGEGTINFICYDPMAHCKDKVYENYSTVNRQEWRYSSGLLTRVEYENFDKFSNNVINIYNPGDKETPFTLKINLDGVSDLQIDLWHEGLKKSSLILQGIKKEEGDWGFLYNSHICLLEGIDSDGNKTGTIYDKYITKGDYFNLPLSTEKNLVKCCKLKITGATEVYIDYDYLYY